MKKSCVLFCDCGSVNRNGQWQALDLSFQCFLASYTVTTVKVVEFRRVTCPQCVKLPD
jgi:hypothetical protein